MGNKTRIFIIILITAVLSGSLVYFILPKKVVSSNTKTNSVELGTNSSSPISGVVQAEKEIFLLSPTRTTVKQVYKEPGSWAEQGDLLLELDDKTVNEDIERNRSQLQMKRVSLEKIQLNSKSTQLDLGYNEEVKKLRITSLKTTLADQKKILEVGGITPERIEKTKQEIDLAEKDLEKLIQKNSIRIKQLAADAKSMQLQINAQEQTLKEKRELLTMLSIKAPASGIILQIVENKGLRVDVDNVLVRLSDLSTFKVVATINEESAQTIQTGNQVEVSVNNEKIQGHIGTINDADENGVVQFDVYLKNIDHSDLTLNQNVEVFLTDNK